MRRRYPFEALRGVRQEEVDQRAVELSDQSRKRERATRERERAELARKTEERKFQDVAANERDRLEQGAAKAADLQAALSFAHGAARRIDERSAIEQAARDREQRESLAEARARAVLAKADADSRAVEKHREGWESARATAEELSAEEDALDHWNSRARGRPGSNEDR